MATNEKKALATKEQNALASQAAMPFDDDYRRVAQPSEDDFYTVSRWDGRRGEYVKTRIPGVRVKQAWAKREHVWIECGVEQSDSGHAKATAKGGIWFEKDGQIHRVQTSQEQVILTVEKYRKEWLLKGLRKNQTRINDDGQIVPANGVASMKLAEFLVQKELFLERDAESKARNRVLDQLLGMDWRSDEERDAERFEVDSVASARGGMVESGPEEVAAAPAPPKPKPKAATLEADLPEAILQLARKSPPAMAALASAFGGVLPLPDVVLGLEIERAAAILAQMREAEMGASTASDGHGRKMAQSGGD